MSTMPPPTTKLNTLETVWSYCHAEHKGQAEFIISGCVEMQVKQDAGRMHDLDHRFFDGILRLVAAQHYRLCCRLVDIDTLELMHDGDVSKLPIQLVVQETEDNESCTLNHIRAIMENDLNCVVDHGGLLWRCRIVVEQTALQEWRVLVFWGFAHVLVDGFGALAVSKTFVDQLAGVLDGRIELPVSTTATQVVSLPPIRMEEFVKPGCCSFLPALWSFIQYGSFDPRPGRFNGHSVSADQSMKSGKTTRLNVLELDQSTSDAFIAMAKRHGASVASAIVTAGLTASRSVFELNLAAGEKVQDKQGFVVPVNGRILVDPEHVAGGNDAANFIVASMHPDYKIVDSDKFWETALDVRHFMQRDMRNAKGRVSILSGAAKSGQIFSQLKQFVNAGMTFPRAMSCMASSFGRIPAMETGDSVTVTNLWGALSLWYISCPCQFAICCATYNGKLNLMVSSPIGPINDEEAEVYMATLKHVIDQTSLHSELSIGDARI